MQETRRNITPQSIECQGTLPMSYIRFFDGSNEYYATGFQWYHPFPRKSSTSQPNPPPTPTRPWRVHRRRESHLNPQPLYLDSTHMPSVTVEQIDDFPIATPCGKTLSSRVYMSLSCAKITSQSFPTLILIILLLAYMPF